MKNNFYSAVLLLSDGKKFFGQAIGKKAEAIGEVCFTTSMAGYQHTITDPSFAEQIITFTFPHIGNVGINSKDYERKKILAKGIIVREISQGSHISSNLNLNLWMEQNNIVGISGVDTRSLTRYLRDQGTQNGIIYCFDDIENVNFDEIKNRLRQNLILSDTDLSIYAAKSNIGDIVEKIKDPCYKIALVDFGVKSGIVLCLAKRGCVVHIVSANYSFSEEVLSLKPDGIVLSNGPGNPQMTALYASKEIDILVKSGIPMMGICLGHQLIALSMGASTVKMDHGHRGVNHPVFDIENKVIEITSQNHGFVVDKEKLPSSIKVTHVSLFDNTIEGIRLNDYPVFSVQYHPEGNPGPYDSQGVFDRFIDLVKNYSVTFKKDFCRNDVDL